jgi:hypothetical protein
LALQELALGIAWGEVGGALVSGSSFCGLAEFVDKTAADGVVEVLCFERMAVWDALKSLQGLVRATDTGEGHGAVHRDDRRGLQEQELIVKTQDAWPVRARFVRREAMTSGDAGFEMIRADDFASGGCSEREDTFFNEMRIPLVAIFAYLAAVRRTGALENL